MDNETRTLQNEAWAVFNAAYHEPKPIAQGLRETGFSLLHQSITSQKEQLYAKGDEQNRQIEQGLRLQQVRAELKTLVPQPVGAA